MSVSAHSLFHFTVSAEHLIGILREGFRPQFCLEDRTSLDLPEGFPLECTAIPMVCFCDIPLSNIADQMDFYGHYGLGMKKEWGIQKGLNPVVYLSPKSSLNRYLGEVGIDALDDEYLTLQTVVELFSFVKPLQGKMLRNSVFVERTFYDEREWRFVPKLGAKDGKEIPSRYRLSKEDYLNGIQRSNANRNVGDNIQLSFEPSDIKYIIVKREDERTAMISAIREIKSKYDAETVDLLASRIISAEQVRDDF